VGPLLHPFIWDWRCSVCDFSCSCVYCDFEFFKFVFSTLRSRSCFQLTNSCLLGGREGSLLWIDILSFLLPIGKFSKWSGEFLYVQYALVRISNPCFSFGLLILVLISCIYCKYVSCPNLRNVLMYVKDCNRLAAPFLWLNYVVWSRP